MLPGGVLCGLSQGCDSRWSAPAPALIPPRPPERWLERLARATADFPAAKGALKRAAAPSGRQPAWPRHHRMTAKPGQRQRCTLPEASRRGSRAPVFPVVVEGRVSVRQLLAVQIYASQTQANQVRAGPAPALQVRPKADACRRAPFLRAVQSDAELFIRALDLFVCLREPFIGRRGFSYFWLRRGVHWRFPFRPMSSEGSRLASRDPKFVQRMAVSWRERRPAEEYGITRRGIRCGGAAEATLPLSLRFHLVEGRARKEAT